MIHAVVSATIVLLSATGWGFIAQPPAHRHEAPAAQPAAPKPVNDLCPVQGEEVDPEAPTRTWRGHAIGFCCPGCEKEWDAKSEADKDAFLAKYVRTDPAVEIARSYQKGLEAGDLMKLDALFLAGGRARVLENASDEGTWERYREEHLKPELKEMAGYRWTAATEESSAFGAATVVRQVGSFTIGGGAGQKRYQAAVTFVVVDDAGTPRIAHMHWSSRAEKPAPTGP